ncbi:unnamed protein product [Caenorhabditis bovis]|uniref:Translation initiation factor eIF2B subunit gamma n=1 Tax=Caenorhabditis bovis TaxID=2654633 RepID=A0A8S1EZN1_9PELO|nr:unnamed protein product [Caenorhabditis bovis]
MSDLQGVLFCAGGGTRMSALTDDIPKCLLPVVGVPMFIYPLSSILRAGVRDIKIFVREGCRSALEVEIKKSGLLEKFAANIDYIVVSMNHEDYGTGDLLRQNHSKITRNALIVSCDFVSDASLLPMIEFFRAHRASLVALLDDNCVTTSTPPGPKTKKPKATDLIAIDEKSGRFGYLSVDEDFDGVLHTEKMSELLARVQLSAKFNDCHVYLIRHHELQILNKHKSFSSFKADFVPYLIDQQFEDSSVQCYAYRLPHENGCVTAHANTIGAYFELNKAILKTFARLMPDKGNGKTLNYRHDGIAANESRVENSVQVGEKSIIKRCVILDHCKIGERAKLKESLIFRNVGIGVGASVTNSIVCEGAEIGEHADVTNCIVTKGQKVGARVKLQNEIVEDDDAEWASD